MSQETVQPMIARGTVFVNINTPYKPYEQEKLVKTLPNALQQEVGHEYRHNLVDQGDESVITYFYI